MQIQPGSVADQTRRIKRGDELIQVAILLPSRALLLSLYLSQVNEHCIKGWTQKDVSDLLSQTSLHVKLVLIRYSMCVNYLMFSFQHVRDH